MTAASVLTGDELSQWVNDFSISAGPPRTIVVRGASHLADLQDITVTGTLLKKQTVSLDVATNTHRASILGTGQYAINQSDGDLHFCLGGRQNQPHVPCELQNAKAWQSAINAEIDQHITVSGFFRCLFEHPGFARNDDAHLFEIHPVRAVTLGGHIQAFDVGVPDQQSIHTWTSPHPLNDQDKRIKVQYDKPHDTLTFTGMDGQDENYVRVSGTMSQVHLPPNSDTPASFTFDSKEIGYALTGLCLQGTHALVQLESLARANTMDVTMIVLRNIDLHQALQDHYVIELLAIDIRAGRQASVAEWPPSP